MKLILLIFIFFIFVEENFSQTSNISGIINNYTLGIEVISTNQIKVNDITGFSIGDTILIYQAQGAVVSTANNSNFGQIINYANAGHYEFSIINNINPTNKIFTLQCPLINSYTQSMFQVIKVKSFINANVTSTLTCAPWNGQIGGVLVLFVKNNLTLNAPIDVSGKGFRGGVQQSKNNLNKCAIEAYIYGYGYTINGYDSAGMKGEGIAVDNYHFILGRGAWANGGGGGNAINAGGGGGGHGGYGGNGGKETSMCSPPQAVGGIGGYKIIDNSGTVSSNRIFFGGGGGTGTFEVNANDNAPGGRGGGIAIVIAKNIIANNFSIKAEGNSVNYITSYESAGGGGAGGTIILISNNIQGNLTLSANGGNGGSSNTISCRGSGGGGSGGIIYYKTINAIPTNVYVSGGNKGSACSGFQGTDGQSGLISTSFILNANCLLEQNIISGNQNICPNFQPDSITGTESYLFINYKWEYRTSTTTWQLCPGINNQPNYQPGILSETTYYRRIVTTANGLLDTSNIVVININPIEINAQINHVNCFGQNTGSILANASGGTGLYSYTWDNGNTTNYLINIPAATYYLTVTDSKGCSNVDTFVVNQPPEIIINISKTDVTCHGGNDGSALATVSGGNPPYTFHWSNGSSSNSISNLTANTYFLTVYDSNGCQKTSQITINEPPQIEVQANIVPTSCSYLCNGRIELQITGGNPPYTINPANLDNLCPGTYTIFITDANGCTIPTTQTVNSLVNLQNNFITPTDTLICKYSTTIINGSTPSGGGVITFNWKISLDGTNWTNAPNINYNINYNWIATQSSYFKRIISSNGCYDTSNIVHIDVININNHIFTNDTIYCNNEQPELILGTDSSGYLYSWQYFDGNNWIDTNVNTSYIQPVLLYPVMKYRRITTFFGCSDTSNIITLHLINLQSLNHIKIDNDTTYKQYCQLAEGNIIPNAIINNLDSVKWQYSTDTINWINFTNTSQNFHFSNTDYSIRYHYYRRIIYLHGCSDTSNIVIIDLLPPIFNFIHSSLGLSSDINVCAGDMLAIGSFINQPSGGNNVFSYLWLYKTNQNPNWMPAPGINDQKNYLVINILDTMYFARIIYSGVCIDTSNVLSIFPIYLPSNEINTLQFEYCFNDTIKPIYETTNTSNSNVLYQWQKFENNQWIDIAGATSCNYTPDFITGTNSYRRKLYFNNCNSFSNVIDITCFEAINANYSFNGNDSLCYNPDIKAEINLHINGTSPFFVTLAYNNNTNNFIQYSNDTTIFIPLQNGYNQIYMQNVSNNTCNGIINNDTIKIWTFNPIIAQSSSVETCGLTATLQATPSEGEGTWILPQNITATNIHDPNTFVMSNSYGTFPIIWKVENGPCVDTNQTNITFYQQPTSVYAGEDIILYNNTPITLNAQYPIGIGTWSVIQGNAEFSDVHSPNAVVTNLSEGINILRWTISNGVCPEIFDDLKIELISIFVPDGFSPNNDGYNDYFVIDGLKNDSKFHLIIFNRWGNIVYENKNYTNNWDGKDLNGNPLPNDTYFYILNKDEKLFKNGYLILKR